ncbi:3-deoxy-D-manno-octulosonic acid transferase [Zhouia spongiae]|uniref:3-deoxy-D-manno-octulosonic acid transferase n=1 Tax=Zhouia spongiae TaxID=2202721 RepID=A0ABY3YP60_9FLAO|nr:glycosyltransferase N-terminal domain-containing protein [Zhouia spongiae]UNY99324.1 3-deoxy-D-manno-octulosonic acid transferase [Zhouia spongiae]
MFFIYNVLVVVSGLLLKIIALFNNKIRLFVNGRKNVFETLKKEIAPSDKIIWFHTASLGEFEQGLPVIEEVKKNYPGYKILVTFFSPSGYEVKKKSKAADIISYLPLDTKSNVKRFLDLSQPELAIFVKYEFWPNYLQALLDRRVKTLLISAIFRKDQAFFKWYGTFMRKSLVTFDHFFVQDENSKQLLKKIGFNNTTVSGDTRFDRVDEILERDNTLDFIAEFINGRLCFVAGSTWPEDEELIIKFINESAPGTKFIIAPHNIKPKEIGKLQNSITKSAVLYTKKQNLDLKDYDVLIVDTIGILTKIYSYANIAYVGGGMGDTGLHNTLEPAVFGIPVIIGENYGKFKEAADLVEQGGVFSIKNYSEFNTILKNLLKSTTKRVQKGRLNMEFIQKNKGAKELIGNYIKKEL